MSGGKAKLFGGFQPTLYGFDSSPGSITLSTSYFVQQMFASNKGDTILPVKASSNFGPLYWVASGTGSQYYVKLANYGPDEQNVTVSIPETQSARLSMLSGTQNQANQPHNITVQTVTSEVKGDGGKYTVTMTPWAIAVLAVS